ncbi:TPA: hypothetical protein HA235_02930 [Candidatus Woesearchaeota archaeon]|nr:hypothetical protein [Candidatus Woesearchaeota archaeon]HIH31638.1 hypothetical protein [Candidatus Woesearchaeota archaeon]HIH55433.1 hypothetical protein [Candidatus Woesearchaeota archaeon]HIJ02059.1 hypothetical protein [Candidatus Woesearchaeota archaeon]HIJ14624.1 hypothetical protein [Candidatus Woesearchaeota archaeon]
MDKVKLEEENEFLESMLKSLDDVKKGRVKEWRFKNLKHSQTAKEQLRQSLMSSEDTITIEEARERLSKK